MTASAVHQKRIEARPNLQGQGARCRAKERLFGANIQHSARAYKTKIMITQRHGAVSIAANASTTPKSEVESVAVPVPHSDRPKPTPPSMRIFSVENVATSKDAWKEHVEKPAAESGHASFESADTEASVTAKSAANSNEPLAARGDIHFLPPPRRVHFLLPSRISSSSSSSSTSNSTKRGQPRAQRPTTTEVPSPALDSKLLPRHIHNDAVHKDAVPLEPIATRSTLSSCAGSTTMLKGTIPLAKLPSARDQPKGTATAAVQSLDSDDERSDVSGTSSRLWIVGTMPQSVSGSTNTDDDHEDEDEQEDPLSNWTPCGDCDSVWSWWSCYQTNSALPPPSAAAVAAPPPPPPRTTASHLETLTKDVVPKVYPCDVPEYTECSTSREDSIPASTQSAISMDIPEYNEVDPFDVPAYMETAISIGIPEYTETGSFDVPARRESAVSVGIPEYTEMGSIDVPVAMETIPVPPRTGESKPRCAVAHEPSAMANTPPRDASVTTEDIFENDRRVRIVHGNTSCEVVHDYKSCEVVHDNTKQFHGTCIDSDSILSTRESQSWADDGNSTASSSSSLSAAEISARSALPAMDQSVRNRKNRIKTIARTIKFKRSKPNAKTCRKLESRQLFPPQTDQRAAIAMTIEAAAPLSTSPLGVCQDPLAENSPVIGVEALSEKEPVAEGSPHAIAVPAAQGSQPQHENEAADSAAIIPVAGETARLVSLLLWMLVQLAVLKMMPVSN
jgi:hypothetical protein